MHTLGISRLTTACTSAASLRLRWAGEQSQRGTPTTESLDRFPLAAGEAGRSGAIHGHEIGRYLSHDDPGMRSLFDGRRLRR